MIQLVIRLSELTQSSKGKDQLGSGGACLLMATPRDAEAGESL